MAGRRAPLPRLSARNVSGAMRPEFGDTGVIPRPMVAPLWQTRIVNSEWRCSLRPVLSSRRRGCEPL